MKTLAQLKRRARKHGLTIRKVEHNEDSYMLVDLEKNFVANYPTALSLADVEAWIDELDEKEEVDPDAE